MFRIHSLRLKNYKENHMFRIHSLLNQMKTENQRTQDILGLIPEKKHMLYQGLRR